jgi:hypothetical protein
MTHKVLRAVQFIHLFLFALVLGVFWGTWFSLSRSITSITPVTFLEVGHLMIANLGTPMSVLMPAALLSAVPVLVMLFSSPSTHSLLPDAWWRRVVGGCPHHHADGQCPD